MKCPRRLPSRKIIKRGRMMARLCCAFGESFSKRKLRFNGHAVFRQTGTRPSGGIPNLPDAVTREAYSHEVCSAGFWPGGPGFEYLVFYSYAYPAPDGFSDATAAPPGGLLQPRVR